jgi:REP element-mobilizing transposase RayT
MDCHRSIPSAYLLTFHSYATWLPGDPRGSVRRGDRYGAPYRAPCEALERRTLAMSRTPPVVLQGEERILVNRTLVEVCRHRAWALLAAHVRTHHVHVVITAPSPPPRILGDLKAWSTRRVIEAMHRPSGARLWARGGSVRHLWTQKAVADACFYVLHEQGDVLLGTVHPAP